ncbi:hypothetical protein Nepgr_001334 [Nepenthes gracilis]|uniref:NTF2-like domain-containing protein n=1 Tax=Nepenthes gracilis TaxID=150966 RepID=A0AAD3RXP2_NEPGR|nr:hypothetical protein Nepgr_001334 [Nepenthes gracilis]
MSTLQLCRCLLDQPRFHVHRFPPALFLSQITPIKVLPFQNQTNQSRPPPPEGVMDQASELVGKKASDIDASKSPKRFCDDIIPHILNLYASRATPRDFEIYAPDATFEDPLMSAHGVKQIKSAFYSLSKVFKESSIVEYNVEENTISPGKHEILIDNKQHYKFWGRDIDMISLIKLDVEEGKVVRHEDRWDKKPLLNRETVQVPLLGRMIEVARRGSMLATHAMMGFGKDPTENQQSQ